MALDINFWDRVSHWTGGSCYVLAGWQMGFRVLPVSQYHQCWDYAHTLLWLAFTCAWDTNSGLHSCMAGTLHLPSTSGIFSLGLCLGRVWFSFLTSDLGVRVMLILKWTESNPFYWKYLFLYNVFSSRFLFLGFLPDPSHLPTHPTPQLLSPESGSCSLILCNSLCMFRTINFSVGLWYISVMTPVGVEILFARI